MTTSSAVPCRVPPASGKARLPCCQYTPRTTEITADEFYVAVLSNEAKVVLAKFKA